MPRPSWPRQFRFLMKCVLSFLIALLVSSPGLGSTENAAQAGSLPIVGEAVELARFEAPEARQGVAVDKDHLYVIGNTVIGKYRKSDFEKVGEWSCEEGDPLIHLNAGIVDGDTLLCAHSNYPAVPMLGSVERFRTDTFEHVGTHSFGMGMGSTTWLDRKDGDWYACFAHYSNRAAEPNRDPSWTQLIRFDAEWRRLEGWAFPAELVSLFGNYSSSGGAFGPGGYLFVTGHDEYVLYVLAFPEGGSYLRLVGRIPIHSYGQAFAFDPYDAGVFYGIIKAERVVVKQRITMAGGD